jgi:hypothetical protein
MKKTLKKVANKVKQDQEKNARKTLLEELFRDFHANRFQVYKMNFFRGIFFGLGSVLGGTVVIAFGIWLMSFLANYITPLSDLFEGISALLKQARE